jgi:hypothetical protein
LEKREWLMVGKRGGLRVGENGGLICLKGDGIKFGKRRKGRKDGQGDFRKEEYLGVVVLKSN